MSIFKLINDVTKEYKKIVNFIGPTKIKVQKMKKLSKKLIELIVELKKQRINFLFPLLQEFYKYYNSV